MPSPISEIGKHDMKRPRSLNLGLVAHACAIVLVLPQLATWQCNTYPNLYSLQGFRQISRREKGTGIDSRWAQSTKLGSS
jgi:hypothetical protein